MLKTLPRFGETCCDASKCPGIDLTTSQVFLNILAVGEAASRFEGAFLANHNLSHGRLMLMVLLDENETGSLRSSELAELAGVSRATITGLLDSLERDKLVERSADPSDRRVVSVHLTAAGKDLLEEITAPFFQKVSQSLTTLTEQEQLQLLSLLGKVHEAFVPPSTPSAS
jgi:DNA-binding MarR family transcriptional regulator